MLVFAAVSSFKVRRLKSRRRCELSQRVGCSFTSGRSCSSARTDFFEVPPSLFRGSQITCRQHFTPSCFRSCFRVMSGVLRTIPASCVRCSSVRIGLRPQRNVCGSRSPGPSADVESWWSRPLALESEPRSPPASLRSLTPPQRLDLQDPVNTIS